MIDSIMHPDHGFRMLQSGGSDNGLPQYFVYNLERGSIDMITDSPQGFHWAKKHVHIPTRGISPDNAKVEFKNGNWQVEPIDPSICVHPLPKITPYIPGQGF